MKLIPAIRKAFDSTNKGWWASFAIETSDNGFRVVESHRRKSATAHSATWDSVTSVCFVDGGLGSDCFYIFTQDSQEPILAPVEAAGGRALWDQLKERQLFPPSVSGEAVRSTTTGAQIWWPTAER